MSPYGRCRFTSGGLTMLTRISGKIQEILLIRSIIYFREGTQNFASLENVTLEV